MRESRLADPGLGRTGSAGQSRESTANHSGVLQRALGKASVDELDDAVGVAHEVHVVSADDQGEPGLLGDAGEQGQDVG